VPRRGSRPIPTPSGAHQSVPEAEYARLMATVSDRVLDPIRRRSRAPGSLGEHPVGSFFKDRRCRPVCDDTPARQRGSSVAPGRHGVLRRLGAM
jgi:hypothetical protein